MSPVGLFSFIVLVLFLFFVLCSIKNLETGIANDLNLYSSSFLTIFFPFRFHCFEFVKKIQILSAKSKELEVLM